MQTKNTVLVLLGSAVLFTGCASKPTHKPRILSSYTPPGAGQAAPLNSRQAIAVPQADVGARAVVVPATPVVPVQEVPAVPAVPAVPVTPQVQAAPVPAQQLVPAQPGGGQYAPNGQQVPLYPGQPSTAPPANSQQFQQYQQYQPQGNGAQGGQPNNGYDDPGRLPVPDPGSLVD